LGCEKDLSTDMDDRAMMELARAAGLEKALQLFP
jgi:hypothetical protein